MSARDASFCDTPSTAGIRLVTPMENSLADATGIVIGTSLDAQATTMQLILDGIDVTPQARTTTARSAPMATDISFIPARPLIPGKHVAQLRFTDVNDARSCYRWAFYVHDLN